MLRDAEKTPYEKELFQGVPRMRWHIWGCFLWFCLILPIWCMCCLFLFFFLSPNSLRICCHFFFTGAMRGAAGSMRELMSPRGVASMREMMTPTGAPYNNFQSGNSFHSLAGPYGPVWVLYGLYRGYGKISQTKKTGGLQVHSYPGLKKRERRKAP